MTFLRSLLIALAGVLMTSCSANIPGAAPSAPAESSDQLPPRPKAVRLGEISPCDLLDEEQRDTLGVGSGRPGVASDGFNSPACIWSRYPSEPRDSYQVRLVNGQGAEAALRSITGAVIVSIHGFPAVETQSPDLPMERHCVLIVDVAAGSHIAIRYEYDGSTVPMTKQLACEKARVAAEMAVQTLVQQAGG